LREMVTKLLPQDSGGVIVRTVAEGVTEDHFRREIDSLLALWKKINRKKSFVRRAPALLQRETSLTRGIIRDLFSAKVDALHVDMKELYNEIEQYLQQIDPDLMSRVHLYTEPTPLFDKFDIESEIRDLFKPRVELPTGGSLVIQPTEALISIDVNTGRYTGKKDPEKTPGKSACATSAASSCATSSTWRPDPIGTRSSRNSGPTSAAIAPAPRRWPCPSWAWSR